MESTPATPRPPLEAIPVVEPPAQPIERAEVHTKAEHINELESAETIHRRIETTEARRGFIDWQAPPPPEPSSLPEHCR